VTFPIYSSIRFRTCFGRNLTFYVKSSMTGAQPGYYLRTVASMSKVAVPPAGGRDRSHQSRLLIALDAAVWAYALLAVLSFLGSPVNEFDDAIPLVDATLVQQGRVPNLDFYSFYPPLGLYIHAAVFNIFGKSIISSRVIGTFFYLTVLFLTGRFLKRRFPEWGPLVPVAVLLVAASIGAGLNLASWPGFALSLIALLSYLLSETCSETRLLSIAGSGLLTGIAIMYRINFGGYVLIVVVIDILLRWWLQGGGNRWSTDRFKRLVFTLATFTLPVLTTCLGFGLVVYGKYVARAASEFVVTAQKLMILRGFINLKYTTELVFLVMLPTTWFSFRILRESQTLSTKAFVPVVFAVANLLTILFYATRPSVASIGLVVVLGSVILLHLFVKRLEPAELVLLLYFCCQLHYFLGRAESAHSRWLPVIATLLLPFLLFQPREESAVRIAETQIPKGTALAVQFVVLVLCVTAWDFRPHMSWAQNGVKLLALRFGNPHVPDSDLLLGAGPASTAWSSVYPDKDEIAALRYLRSRSTPADPIFVGVADHSRVFWTDLRIYWLADRPIGTRTFQLETRVATEAPVQKEIISDLSRNRVRWMILDCAPVRGDDNFVEQAYQGSTLLDEFLRDHYREDARFGRYAVLRRIEESASGYRQNENRRESVTPAKVLQAASSFSTSENSDFFKSPKTELGNGMKIAAWRRARSARAFAWPPQLMPLATIR
jgi:hypothetical protein